jgi:Lamin Tail Domain
MCTVFVPAIAALFAGVSLFGAPPPRTIADVLPGQGPRRLALPVPATEAEANDLLARDAALRQALQKLGPGWTATFDRRNGRPLFLEGPGLPWAAAAIDGHGRSRRSASAGATARSWLGGLGRGLGIEPDTLAVAQDDQPETRRDTARVTLRSKPLAGAVHHEGRLSFVLNHGNLVQIHAERLHARQHALTPALDAARAWDHLRSMSEVPDSARQELAELRSVDLAPSEEPSGVYTGALGHGYDTHLAWVFRFRVPGDQRTLVAQVDAQTGELLELFDDNRYGHVSGSVYPRSASGGAETSTPFVDVTVSNEVDTEITDLGGSYNYPGGNASTNLAGAYFTTNDSCGTPEANTATDPGDLHFGPSAGTDCSFSAEGYSTRAARNTFYHLNNVRRLGQKWLEGFNTTASNWFASDVTANVNLAHTCNSFWDGTNLNFLRSGGGCANSGEIADIVEHEWGHALDQNTKGESVGDFAKGEAIADTVAFLMTRNQCVGTGFFLSAGNGETSTCPTSVRDVGLLVTRSNIASICATASSCAGALGFECHCESHLLSGAHWNLASLFVQKYGQEEGWNRFEHGFLRALPGITAYLRNTAGNAYDAWMAADDDNGNVIDGTPNADIIFQAFNARGIAGTQRATHTTRCPTSPTAPQASADAGPDRVDLSWPPVPEATSYAIFRTEPLTKVFLPLASGLTTNSYTDLQVASGYTYRYQVVAFSNNDQCASPYGPGVPSTGVAELGTAVISQVYGGGGNSGAPLKNDYIELYNPGLVDVSLEGWSVQYGSFAGSTWQVTPLSGAIGPGGYYLVQEAAGAGVGSALPTPDATGAINMSAVSGKVALVSNAVALIGACPASLAFVDLVGYGRSNCAEASPTASLSNRTAALRNGDGPVDTNDNSADFVVAVPTPRNAFPLREQRYELEQRSRDDLD